MQHEFALLLQEFGEPENARRMSYEDAAVYHGRVPESLIDFWVEHGRGSYQRGRNWICDPAPFRPIVDAIFADDPELRPDDLEVIQRSSFADLTLWSRRIDGPITVDLNFGEVIAFGEQSWIDPAFGRRHSPDFIVSALFNRAKYQMAIVDKDDEDMFPQALGAQGQLEPDEVYGFFPALQLGGDILVKNVRRVKVIEHMLFLCELSRFQLMRADFSNMEKDGGRLINMRPIGKR